MPLKLPIGLPAIETLRREHVAIIDDLRGAVPMRVAILNLMPMKETTELDLLRLLGCSTRLLEVHFMKLRSHTPRHASAEHMLRFYEFFDEIARQPVDRLIITGAPVEQLDFEEVTYWSELCQIMDWARRHVPSTLYICWAAQAGLYHHFGIPKYGLPKKMFGIFEQRLLLPQLPIVRGFDDRFFMPHSRHTEIRRADIDACAELQTVAESAECGVSMVMARSGRELFVTGHMEYAPTTLDEEYRRDFGRRDDVEPPLHYYPDDDPTQPPLVRWRAHARLLYENWTN